MSREVVLVTRYGGLGERTPVQREQVGETRVLAGEAGEVYDVLRGRDGDKER